MAGPPPIYRSWIQDRYSIFENAVDEAPKSFGVRALKTPVRAPKAKRPLRAMDPKHPPERLDCLILRERHLQTVLKEYAFITNPGALTRR